MNENIQRYYKKADLPHALRELKGRPLVVFDLETNGLSNRSSVLSCSAFKFSIRSSTPAEGTAGFSINPDNPFVFPEAGPLQLTRVFERYYFSREPENMGAIRVNGLSEEVIRRRRGNEDWPAYFSDDQEFLDFLGDAGLFVAHNIDFDAQFVPFLYDKPLVCTMKSNSIGKYPKLAELARRFKISTEGERLHGSSYDTYITALIFNKMVEEALPASKQREMFF
jgi:DNA polymerase-3 subunit epsilon